MGNYKHYLLILAAALCVSAPACSDDNDDTSSGSTVTVSTYEITFDSDGGTQSFQVTASSTPTVTSGDSWCGVTYVNVSSDGTYTYRATAEENTGDDDRSTTISVTAGKSTATIAVSQAAAGALTVGQSSYDDIPAEGQDITVTLSSNGDYSWSANVTWITQSSTKSRAITESEITFTIAANTGLARTGVITFTLDDLSQTVTINQLAGGTSSSISGETPAEIANSMGLGWNLGNQLDAHNSGYADETCWGNGKATQTTFDKVAEIGFTSVRIPVTWMGHIGDAPDYTIDEDWLDRVYEVVEYAESAGLNAIINVHHDGAEDDYWLNISQALASDEANAEIEAKFVALWTQIATKFIDKGDFLMFEAMNEIHDGTWGLSDTKLYDLLNEWNQLFVNAVRATGGNNASRYLGVPGYCTNIDYTVAGFELPDDSADNRLLVAVHYYDPYNYTLNATVSEWGHTGSDTDGWGDEDYLVGQMAKMKTNFIDKGIPAYIGEMGCVRRGTTSGEAFRQYYLEYLCKACRDYNMAPFYWDNGYSGTGTEASALINHSTGEYDNDDAEPVVEAMKRGLFTTGSDYTLDSVYDSAP